MLNLVLPGIPVAISIYLGYLAFKRPAVLLQHFSFARNMLVLSFGLALAFGVGIESTYRALLPFLDAFEVKQAEVAMGWLMAFDPIWIGTGAVFVFMGLYSLRALARDARDAENSVPRHPLKRRD